MGRRKPQPEETKPPTEQVCAQVVAMIADLPRLRRHLDEILGLAQYADADSAKRLEYLLSAAASYEAFAEGLRLQLGREAHQADMRRQGLKT